MLLRADCGNFRPAGWNDSQPVASSEAAFARSIKGNAARRSGLRSVSESEVAAMERERQEEMISAYLDGELAPEERTQVEQWLGDSAELRQLRDDLLAVRASLRRLPSHKPPRDFCAAIQDSAISPTQDNADADNAPSEPVSLRSLWAQ